MSNRISEELKVDCLPIRITSATTFDSPAIPTKGVQTAAFIVSMATASAGQGVTITGYQGVSTNAFTTALAGATATLGSTVANYVGKAKTARIYMSTATTDNETVIINGTTFNYVSTGTGTAANFGATAGASAAAGVALAMLATMINRQLPNLAATTGASWVDLAVKDDASTSISITSTGGGMTPAYLSAQTILEIQTVGLNATCDYVGVRVSSASTAFNGSITVLRRAEVLPARAHGQIVNDINT